MNIKRYLLASVAVFILFQITGYIIHGVLLMKTYESLPSLWRPDMMSLMWAMYITSAVYSLMFVYIYTKWRKTGGITEGLVFGIVIALFMNVVGIGNQYVVYPIPFSLAIQWFIYGTIEILIAGILAALVYKPAGA